MVGRKLPFLLSGYGKEGSEGGRGREREIERVYCMQEEVGFCSQSHLYWERSFSTGEQWRQTDVVADKSEETEREILTWISDY